jgi:hypothetical protein
MEVALQPRFLLELLRCLEGDAALLLISPALGSGSSRREKLARTPFLFETMPQIIRESTAKPQAAEG